MKEMKTYISLPITGQEDTLFEREKEYSLQAINASFGDIENVVTPSMATGLTPENIDEMKANHDWAWFMGQCIEELLRCDVIVMCPGWENSRGCRIEHDIAIRENMMILYL